MSDGRFFRDVLGHCPTAVSVICSPDEEGGFIGMTVGSFLSISLEPPLVGFLPAKNSTTWPKIEKAGKFCASILGQDQLEICNQFFSKSHEDRFADVNFRLSDNGSPILQQCVAWTDCDIEAVHEAGDHYIVVGRVKGLAVERPFDPLLFFQGKYRSLAPPG